MQHSLIIFNKYRTSLFMLLEQLVTTTFLDPFLEFSVISYFYK